MTKIMVESCIPKWVYVSVCIQIHKSDMHTNVF